MAGYAKSSGERRTGGEGEDKFSLNPPILAARQILAACGLGRILDVDCGTGVLVKELVREGADAYGLDASATAIAKAERFVSNRFITGSVLALPFEDNSFDTVVSLNSLEHLSPQDVSRAFKELHRVCRRHVYLRVTVGRETSDRLRTMMNPRAWLETLAFEAGFRKHPYCYNVNFLQAQKSDPINVTLLLEKIESSTLQSYPLEDFRQSRALHVDTSRESGTHSDIHNMRYALAAEWVRPSDTVLDYACGSGYGSAILAVLSKGKQFVGMVVEEGKLSYARDNFGDLYGIRYLRGTQENMSCLSDDAIDTLVSFETFEHLPHFELFLAEARRVLRPDGRIIINVSGRSESETDHARASLEAQGFMIEAHYAQFAHHDFSLPETPLRLEKRPLHLSEGNDVECWIVVASANPLVRTKRPYSHPDFQRSSVGESYHLTDFAKHYCNPWLYRPLVQMGERLSDPELLGQLAQNVLTSAPPDSADYGAALAVIGYQVLSNKESASKDGDVVIDSIVHYLGETNGNPHVLRWKTSLAFLAALLSMKKGDQRAALHYFILVTKTDPCVFSPLLATKVVAACFWCGILNLTAGDGDSARAHFSFGVESARRALHAPDENAIGNPHDPLVFGFPELAEVADMASQCTNALHYLEEFNRAPGKFWRAVDTRRFGLATWALSLQSELEAIRDKRQLLADGFSALHHDKSPLTRAINAILGRIFGVRLVRLRTLRQFSINKK